MSRCTLSEDATIGYRVKKGDYIVMTTAFNMSKGFSVTRVTLTTAVCAMSRGGERHSMSFPRIYHKPYLPIQRVDSDYESTNIWSVRINDTRVANRMVQ